MWYIAVLGRRVMRRRWVVVVVVDGFGKTLKRPPDGPAIGRPF